MMSLESQRLTVAGGTQPPATVKVWDVFVRLFHWGLVASFAVAWLSADEWDRLHEWAGYAACALVGLRVVWGFVGTKHARFSDFVRSPLVVLSYLNDVLWGRERRYLGHNPAGGAMIVALLLGIIGLGLTGWMMTVDRFWGAEWVEELHEVLAHGLLALVILHVFGVLFASVSHRENLVRAMLTGRKRCNSRNDGL